MTQELTEEDLEIAEASVRFALENCPVEGLLSTEDGSYVSFDMLRMLLERLNDLEKDPDTAPRLSREEMLQLGAVVGYTYENCPIEGVATLHDGRPISGKDSGALVARIRELLAG